MPCRKNSSIPGQENQWLHRHMASAKPKDDLSSHYKQNHISIFTVLFSNLMKIKSKEWNIHVQCSFSCCARRMMGSKFVHSIHSNKWHLPVSFSTPFCTTAFLVRNEVNPPTSRPLEQAPLFWSKKLITPPRPSLLSPTPYPHSSMWKFDIGVELHLVSLHIQYFNL